MFMVISVSPLAPQAAPKCADVTELMGLKKKKKLTLLLTSGQLAAATAAPPSSPPPKT